MRGITEGVLPRLEMVECGNFGADGHVLARVVTGQWFSVFRLEVK